jgi:predicted permease
MNELRHAIRGLAKSPGFASVAVITLAVGIGANLTAFALIEAVLLRPLSPFEPERVVRIGTSSRGGDQSTRFAFSYADYHDIATATRALSAVAGSALTPFVMRTNVQGSDSSEILGEIVSGNYFAALHITTPRGRLLAPRDDRRNAAPTAVISRRAEERHFAGRDALGSTIFLNGRPYLVVGIAPEEFRGTFVGSPIDAWIPIETADAFFAPDWRTSRAQTTMSLVARLKEGATHAQAQADLDAISAQIRRTAPDARRDTRLHVLDGDLLRGRQRQGAVMFALVLTVLVGLVLLIVCANVANLLLARGIGVRRQMAVRLALGAGRTRVMALVMTESLVLAAAGGVAAVAVASGLAGALSTFDRLPTLTIDLGLRIDAGGLWLAGLLALAAGVILGVAPAVHASRADVAATLREESGTVTGGRGVNRLRSALVVAQVAVSLLLLSAAGLFTRSLANARQIDLGFDARHAAAIDIDLSAKGLTPPQAHQLLDELQRRLRARSDVAHVAFSNRAPVDISTPAVEVVTGKQQLAPGQRAPEATMYSASPDYFDAIAIPILHGRGFRDADNVDAPRVAIVNETMARRFWNGDAIGQRFRTGADEPSIEVVGVARDSRYRSPGELPQPHVYLPFAQTDGQSFTLIVQTSGDPRQLLPVLRRELERLPTPVEGFFGRTLRDHLSIYLVPSEVAAAGSAVLGAVAMLLASVGLYGLIAYMVSQRTKEIALRLALGAEPSRIRSEVLRRAIGLLVPGCVLGVLGSIAMGRIASGMLYGIGAVDPPTLTAAIVLLATVAVTASYLPARRAMRVDPARAQELTAAGFTPFLVPPFCSSHVAISSRDHSCASFKCTISADSTRCFLQPSTGHQRMTVSRQSKNHSKSFVGRRPPMSSARR